MAETEHRRWNAAKLLDGYVLNAQKNDDTLTHPNLVPFEDLDGPTQCFDYAYMYNISELASISEEASQPPGTSS